MFTLVKPAPTFDGQMRITMPGQEATGLIRVTWRHKTTEEVNDWITRTAQGASDLDSLSEVIETWHEVVDPEGKPVPYTRFALKQLLSDYPASGQDIFRSYLKDLTASRIKN